MSFRKLLGALTGLAMISATLPLGATGADGFTDIDGNVHAGAIERIADLGITKGCNPPDNDLYCPDDAVTRGQMAAFMTRALSLTAPGISAFDDTVGHLFEVDIARLADAGITKGCNPPTNSRFCPDEEVTRGQMAAFLVRALGLTHSGTSKFTDTSGHIFENDIAGLAAAGITRGCNPPTNSRFCPDQSVRRDEMATFLSRAYDIATTGTTTSSTSPTSSTSSTTTSSTTPEPSTTSVPETTTTTTASIPSGVFLEEEGVIVMEVESVNDTGTWELGTGFGSTGDGFYFSDTTVSRRNPGFGVLAYEVWITEPGVYVATVRSRRDRTAEEICDPNDPVNPRDPDLLPDEECVENGERNDIFLRMDDEPWHEKLSKGTTHANFGGWGWIDKWREDESVDGACPSPDPACDFRAFTWYLDAGPHTLEISERAEQIKIDRILLYRSDADPFDLPAVRAGRPATTTPESDRTD